MFILGILGPTLSLLGSAFLFTSCRVQVIGQFAEGISIQFGGLPAAVVTVDRSWCVPWGFGLLAAGFGIQVILAILANSGKTMAKAAS